MSSAIGPRPGTPGTWTRIKDLILPLALIASLLVILVPMPAGIMDLLLAAKYHRRGDNAADDALHPHAARVQYIPIAAAGHDVVPSRAERSHHSADTYPGEYRWTPGRWRRWCERLASS